MAVSVVTMQLVYVSVAIMQVTTCCILAGFQLLLSVTVVLVDLSVIIAVMQLEVSAAHIQVTDSAVHSRGQFLQQICG